MIVLLYLATVVTVYVIIRLTRFAVYQYGLYYKMKDLPGPEIRSPFIGNLDLMWRCVGNQKGVSKRFYHQMIELCDTYGKQYGFFRLWFGPLVPWIVVCDASLARKVLTNKYYTNKASYYRIMENFAVGTSLFTTSAFEARRERKHLKEHFTLRYLESYIPKMEKHLKNLEKKIDNCIENNGGYYYDFNNLVSTFIYDTVGDNLFSSKFTSITTGIEPRYVAAIHDMIGTLEIAILQPWRYLFSPKVVVLTANLLNHMFFSFTVPAVQYLYRFHTAVYEIVIERYRALVSPDGRKVNFSKIDASKPSLLDSLILSRMFAHAKQSKLLGFIDVMWHMNMFIIAGHDTSTASISWTLYNMAHFPEVQQKAREEVIRFLEELASRDEKPSQLNLKRLTYLECCIKETLRLYPVAPFLGRSGTQPLEVFKGLSIPPFTNVTVFYDYMHRQEKYFPSPNQFIPERFLDQTHDLDLDKATLNPNQAIMPFSLGERGCLGQQYAMTQMKLLFVSLLSKYEMTPLEEFGNINEEHHFLTKPPSFPVKFVRRN